MSITEKVARECADQVDSPALISAIAVALQTFVSACSHQGMKLPLSVTIADSDGDTVRDFVIEGNGRRPTLGKSSDAYGFYVAPFTVIGIDADGHVGLMKIVPRSNEDATSVDPAAVEFVN